MNEEIVKNINQRLDKALDRSRELLTDDELVHKAEELQRQAEELVRKHPVKSVLIGFTAGYILAKLFSSQD